VEIVERSGEKPARELLDTILHEVDAWMDVQHDDVTALVIRYQAHSVAEPNFPSQSLP
jgi:CBS-domain-containing membrane protein